MKIEIGKNSITIDWKTITAITGAIVINFLSKREQLKNLNIDLKNKTVSLNQ